MPNQRPPAPFVVGVPRSGTTLLRLMLDAHPQLAIPAETHFFPELIERWPELAGDGTAANVIRLITGHPRWPELGITETQLRERLGEAGELDLPASLRAVGETYAVAAGKSRWGDKTPGYVTAMEQIQGVLPEARFVHVIRDGRDVAVSLARVAWGPSDATAAAQLWTRRIRIARRQSARLAGTYTEVRYEDLVNEPREVLERLCGFLELPFTEEMLSYWEGGAKVLSSMTAERRRQHASVTRPPTPERIGRWRRDLADDERRRFESVAGETLAELGYEVGA
jgi:Sulfotransferase family